ncbi:MAG: DUF2321 domain-containing protein [Candidatus Marinimicrobia bacterium]|nr:DUF2321 domain-containing protein [candidate division WOR-3 bacterium]MCK4448256.1 DUF2321 domain-containing protein [Candidatus Neomarinimicrobiota bacterium]
MAKLGDISVAQICLNGHIISTFIDQQPESSQDFCKECGQKTITSCPNCGAKIQGYPLLADKRYPPKHCHKCGKPYPWTKKRIEAAQDALRESDEIPDEDKKYLEENIYDLMLPTPKTEFVAKKIEERMKKAPKPVKRAIRNFLIDFGAELIVKWFRPY